MRDPEANERLTAATAVVLLVLLAVEGVTIVFLRPLLPVHMFVGVLLIPPVALKLASVGWRFARYYLGDAGYRAAGPPWLVVASAHVLTYVWRLPRLVLRERRFAVYGVVVASVLVGLAAALETMPFEERWLG